MTPAVKALDASGLSYRLLEYDQDAKAQGEIGLAAARALNLPEQQVFKTLIAELTSGELVVAIIPVARKLNLKSLARACSASAVTPAELVLGLRQSGCLSGRISA